MGDNNTRFVLSAVDQTGPAFESVHRGMSGVESMAGTLGITLSAVGMIAFIQHSINAADELAKLSRQTGNTVEDLSGLKFAAEQNGTSLDMVAQAAKKLSVTLTENKDVFAKHGVTATNSIDAMVQMADIFAAMPDGVEKTNLAMKVFGKSAGPDLIEFMSQGSSSMRDYIEQGKKLSKVNTESTAQAKEFNDQLAVLKSRSEGVAMGLTNKLLPSLLTTIDAYSELTKESKALDVAGSGVASMVGQTVVAVSSAGFVFIQMGNAIGGAAAQLTAFAKGDYKGAREIGKQMGEEFDTAIAKMDAFNNKILHPATASIKTEPPKLAQDGKEARDLAAGLKDRNGQDSAAKQLAQWQAAEDAKIIAMNIEAASGEKLGESYKALLKLNEEQKNSLIALTGAEYMQKTATLERSVVAEIALKQSEADKKALEDYEKVSQQYMTTLGSETVALIDKANALEYSNSLIGKSPEQITALTEAHYNEQIGMQAVEAARLDGIAGKEAELFLINQKITALGKIRDAEANKSPAFEGITSTNLSQSLTDSIMRGFENGKPFAQNFADSFGNMLKTSIVEKSIKGSVTNLVERGTLGKGDTMTSAEKGSMYLAVAAVAVSYLGNKETVMTAQQRQSLQGTGTVLGDYNAKSASIASGIDVIAKASMDATPVTMSMAASLKSVDASMKDFLTVAVKSMGGSFSANMGIVPGQMSNPALKDTGIAAGAAAGAAIGSYFGPWGTAIGGVLGALGGATSKTDRTISDKGLNISGTLGQFRSGGGSISQYVSGVDTSSSMFGLYNSTDAWRKQQAVGSDVNVAFANIFSGMATTFKTAAGAMGKDSANFDATMNAMNVNIGDLSLMNMSVTEQQTAIMNVISKTSDTMARTLFPEMVKYNVAGEGMAQTVIRVVAQNEAVITAFNRMGGVQTKITNSSFQMTDELSRAAGGLDKLLTGLQQFTKFYTTGANQLANTYADAKTKFSGTALDAVISNQTTANEIAAYVRAAMNSGISADSKVQILDAANSFSSFLTSMKDGIDKLRQSYDSVISSRDAVVGSIKNLQQFNVTMQEFRRSVVADNSLSNPVAKYTDAKRYFDDIAARSAAGDSVAQGKLQSASQALLSMSMTASGSYAQYQRDVSSVLQAVDSTMSYNDKMITNGKDMLSALDTLNGISDVIRQNTWATNTSMMDMSKVLGGYAAATSALGISSSTAAPEAKKALVDYVSKGDANFSSIVNALSLGGGAAAATGVAGNQVTSAALVAASPASTAAADAAIALSISNDRRSAKASALDALNAITSTVDKMSLDIIALERAAGGHTTAASYDMRHARIPLLTKQQALQNAYEALPSFAIGSNYIQHDGPAYIHAGEEITPRPYVDLQRSARDETNSLLARLVASSTDLRAELKTLTENQTKDNQVIKASTQATAELLDANSAGGGPMLVKVVTA